MIPVGVADHNVGDRIGLHTGSFHGFVGAQVILHGEVLQKSVAVIPAIEKDGVAATPDQPYDHGDIDFLILGSADYHL